MYERITFTHRVLEPTSRNADSVGLVSSLGNSLLSKHPKEMQVVKGPHSEKLLVNWPLRSSLQLAQFTYQVRMSHLGPVEDCHICS